MKSNVSQCQALLSKNDYRMHTLERTAQTLQPLKQQVEAMDLGLIQLKEMETSHY